MALLLLTLALLSGPAADVSPDSVAASVTAALRRALAERKCTDALIEVRSVPPCQRVPAASVALVPRIEPGRLLKGTISVPVEVVGDGKVLLTLVVAARVRTFATLLFLKRSLDRHEEIAPDDILPRRSETTLLGDNLLTDPKEISGMRSTHMIGAGAVLREDLLEPIPLVHANDVVTAIVHCGTVTLTSRAVAKNDASLGSAVVVQREGEHMRLRGRVAGPATVEIVSE